MPPVQSGDLMKTPININAPVIERQAVFIEAPSERVWNLLSSVNEWPGWQNAVTEAYLDGPLSEGAEFKWKAGGIGFQSRLHTVEPFQYLGWTGKTIGTFAVHNWYLVNQGKGTLVRVEESLQGFLPFLFRRLFKKDLVAGMRKQLQELKEAAENHE